MAWESGHGIGVAAPADLPLASPRDLGFSSERLANIDKFYDSKVAQGEMAGIVVLVARNEQIAHFSAVGYADLGTKRKMEKDTIFRIYSMTKPIASTALMILYEEGKFQLDDPISKHIPEFAGLRVLRTQNAPIEDTVPAVREPTIHDLFRHTAGLSHAADVAGNAIDAAYIDADLFGLNTSLVDMMERLAKLPLLYQPGTTFQYSIGPDVQARLVEILSGMPFDRFLQNRLFGPLGMKDTAYRVKDSSRLAQVHWSKRGKLVPCDDAHGCPKPARYFLHEPAHINNYTRDNAHKGGSYGLAGTTMDYWRFAQMLLNGGQLDGQWILSRKTVSYIAQDHLETASTPIGIAGARGFAFGLGFAVLKDPVAAGIIGSEGNLYWSGAANTFFWIDPHEDLVVVAMTQHMEVPTATLSALRSDLSAMVYGALIC